MANSTTNIDTISSSQAQKEVTANAYFDAASPATTYGRRSSTTSALTWGYYGGTVRVSNESLVQVANGNVSLTASTTNYVEANPANGAVSNNTTAFTAGYWPLYSIVTGSSTVTSYTDYRCQRVEPGLVGKSQSISYAANITPDCLAGERVVVGAMTANMTVNAPTNPRTGAALDFCLLQDGTGGWEITWNAVFRKAADAVGAADEVASTRFVYNGANWVQQGGALAWL